MNSSNPFPQFLSFFILIFPIFFSPSLSDPRTSIADIFCQSAAVTTGDEFVSDFTTIMEALSRRVAINHWGSFSIKSSSSNIFGFAQCYTDLSHNDCLLCFKEARAKLSGCLPTIAGRVYLDGCFIRYDVYEFMGESVVKDYDSTKCGRPTSLLDDKYMEREFANNLNQGINNVTAVAAANKGFGVVEVKSGVVSAYAMGQCWNTIDESKCRHCLKDAGNKVMTCVPGAEGRALNAGCYLRYSTHRFFDEKELKKEDGALGLSKNAIVGMTITLSLGLLLLSLFGALVGYKRYSERKEERKKVVRIPSAVNKSNLHFKYETLEQATDCFNPLNKLGQGGSGSVFKGTLPDGRTIAVKRLFFNTRQWVDDFFNEVNLISGIQHKNLVRLLGCSIEGPESLLVYEFIPNKSLDQILFDKNKAQFLNWHQRFDIIIGIAEGLAYLHGGCEATIIHRDIKKSNILLDENLTPKIADFGLARCVAPNRTHISTAIAGTLGYMAPEYLVRGQLTEKADVYAFGVLVLEIACGRKNNVFANDSGSVLQCVWKNYKLNNILQSIDSSLKGDFQEKEASNALQVGLLCTQTAAKLRPSMTTVVQMLTDKEFMLHSPKQPPFLNSSVLASDDTTKSSTIDSSFSNFCATIDVLSADTSKSTSIASPHSQGPIENV